MTVTEAINYIENYDWSSTKLGLDRTKELLNRVGNPQKSLKFVHVAGSNGKGSTCAVLESVLRTAGYKTGMYTSPYIIDFCERIQVNNENIDGEALARITDRVRAEAEAMEDHPSQFELVTVIGMLYFKECNCDIVVLEVGMGGALDSTNAIDAPEVAVITNIGLEHTEYLGNTLEEIAATKGGIIKPGCNVVCYDGAEEVTATIRNICDEKGVPFTLSDFGRITPLKGDIFDGQEFLWDGKLKINMPLLGEYQLHNACVALHVLEALRERGYDISDDSIVNGFAKTGWPARFEVLSKEPLFILDGGHNPQCAEALASNLRLYLNGRNLACLIGVLADKDYNRMLDEVEPFIDHYYCVTPNSPRALGAKELAAVLSERGKTAKAYESISDAMAAIKDNAEPAVIAFGSLYMAGEIRTLALK